MIVPVIVTAIALFPFLLYIVFADESLIPLSIKMHELSDEAKAKKPVNPNIPNARGNAEEEENIHLNDEQGKILSLEEIMNPFLDKGGAAFGAAVMAATLITVLVLNAVSQKTGKHPVFYVTLPAAVVMFCWDLAFGWHNRHETREIARKGRQEVENARAERRLREEEQRRATNGHELSQVYSSELQSPSALQTEISEKKISEGVSAESRRPSQQAASATRPTLVSITKERYRWFQETFPTVSAVMAHLPFALIPFAFSMFVLVQALVTKGWVPVFARGWDHWVEKTGTVGAIGGMGFISVILCNVSLSHPANIWNSFR